MISLAIFWIFKFLIYYCLMIFSVGLFEKLRTLCLSYIICLEISERIFDSWRDDCKCIALFLFYFLFSELTANVLPQLQEWLDQSLLQICSPGTEEYPHRQLLFIPCHSWHPCGICNIEEMILGLSKMKKWFSVLKHSFEVICNWYELIVSLAVNFHSVQKYFSQLDEYVWCWYNFILGCLVNVWTIENIFKGSWSTTIDCEQPSMKPLWCIKRG